MVTLRKPGAPIGGGPKPTARAKPVLREKPRAPLTSLQADDPIDEGRYPGDIEGDAEEELSQLSTGFRERMKQEQERFQQATATGYYFVAVFQTEEQCDAFLKAAQLDRRGDLFIDGRVLADRMEIGLPEADVRYNTGGKPSLAHLVRKPKR